MSALPKPGSSIRERIEQLSLVPLLDDPKITALTAAHVPPVAIRMATRAIRPMGPSATSMA